MSYSYLRLVSADIVYDGDNKAEVTFARTKAASRCVLVGLGAWGSVNGRIHKHELLSIKAGTTEFVRNGRTNLALVAHGPFEKFDAVSNPRGPGMAYFPGSHPLRLNGGLCGAIPMFAGEPLTIAIQQIVAGNPLMKLIAYAVELPKEGEDADVDAFWEGLLKNVGALGIYGNKKTYNAALVSNRQTVEVKDTLPVRRVFVDGLPVVNADASFDAAEYLAATVQVSSNEQPGHASLPEPCSMVFGADSLHVSDLTRECSSYVELTSPATGGTPRTWYLVTWFETRAPESVPMFKGPAAIG